MKKISTLLTAALASMLMGCLQSPLLNHANADSLEQIQPVNAACPFEFKTLDLCATLTWVKMPTDDEKGEFVLSFFSKSSGTVKGPFIDPGYTVTSKLWMPSMGHGSSPVKISAFKDQNGATVTGVYNVSDVYFMMPGAWEIWVALKQGATVVDQAKTDISI